MRMTSQFHLDFLGWKPIRVLVRRAAFPVALQACALVAIMWLAMIGIGIGPGMKSDDLMTLRKTNLTTLFVWGLWWPAMIAAALALGRAWCMVCPMELVNRVGHEVAQKLGWPRARLGRFARAGWITVVLYLALQLLVAGVSIHRVPHFTAIMLLSLFGIALVSGFVFREHRSFCRAFCPAAPLLSVYGRYTPIQLDARDPSVCESCTTKDCVRAENRERFDKRSCPSLLSPYHRAASDGCVLCLQCVKVCPYENMSIGLVAASASIRRKAALRPFEGAFVMIALGFVAHEVIGEVKWLDAVFHAAPMRLNALLPSISFGWFEALWFLLLFPFLTWAAIAGIGRLAGHRTGIRSLLLVAATGAAPVVAMAHLAKAAAKVVSWSGFLPLAINDPQGLETLHRIADHSLAAPVGLLSLSAIGWVMLVATTFIALHACRSSGKVFQESAGAARAGLIVSSLLYASVLVAWVWPLMR